MLLSENLESWMTNLPSQLRRLPIIYLAIPGSHDSMSYGIKTNSPVAPDASSSVETLHKFVPCIVKRWAITQKLCVTNQLCSGVRYFDLRISRKLSDNQFYFVHGLYSEEILHPLNELKAFLLTHPCEFFILDCQHFYNFTGKDYARLEKILLDLFGDKIYGRYDGHLDECTLRRMAEMKKQLLIIFRHNQRVPMQFWPATYWPTPWPNQININELKQFLDDAIFRRPKECGYVTQCVLTPSVQFIVPRFFSSLKETCAQPVLKKLSKWITEQQPGPYRDGDKPTCNVFIADFVDIQDMDFCKMVIDLNSKILSEDIMDVNK